MILLAVLTVPVSGLTQPIPVPRQKPLAQAPVPPAQVPWSAAEIETAQSECKAMLDGLPIVFTAAKAIGGPQGCGAAAPVLVNAVDGVKLNPPATLTCTMARYLHLWVTTSLQPAAQAKLGTGVTEIKTASSYVCRGRNNLSGGKLSEHGKANALDMAGFAFGRSAAVSISDGWGPGAEAAASGEQSFLEAVRLGACTQFTTVLGPGSDPYHGDHFHVDAIQRKNDYRICQ